MKYLMKITMIVTIAWGVLLSTGCTDASIASRNLSKAAEQFEIARRIVFYNGITGEYMLSMEGLCSTEQLTNKLAVTCKTGPDSYNRQKLAHIITGLSSSLRQLFLTLI